jgi:hypothetical protein
LRPNKRFEASLFIYDNGGATGGRKGEQYEKHLLLPLDDNVCDFG